MRLEPEELKDEHSLTTPPPESPIGHLDLGMVRPAQARCSWPRAEKDFINSLFDYSQSITRNDVIIKVKSNNQLAGFIEAKYKDFHPTERILKFHDFIKYQVKSAKNHIKSEKH